MEARIRQFTSSISDDELKRVCTSHLRKMNTEFGCRVEGAGEREVIEKIKKSIGNSLIEPMRKSTVVKPDGLETDVRAFVCCVECEMREKSGWQREGDCIVDWEKYGCATVFSSKKTLNRRPIDKNSTDFQYRLKNPARLIREERKAQDEKPSLMAEPPVENVKTTSSSSSLFDKMSALMETINRLENEVKKPKEEEIAVERSPPKVFQRKRKVRIIVQPTKKRSKIRGSVATAKDLDSSLTNRSELLERASASSDRALDADTVTSMDAVTTGKDDEIECFMDDDDEGDVDDDDEGDF